MLEHWSGGKEGARLPIPLDLTKVKTALPTEASVVNTILTRLGALRGSPGWSAEASRESIDWAVRSIAQCPTTGQWYCKLPLTPNDIPPAWTWFIAVVHPKHASANNEAAGTLTICHDFRPSRSQREHPAPWQHRYMFNLKALTLIEAAVVADGTIRGIMQVPSRRKVNFATQPGELQLVPVRHPSRAERWRVLLPYWPDGPPLTRGSSHGTGSRSAARAESATRSTAANTETRAQSMDNPRKRPRSSNSTFDSMAAAAIPLQHGGAVGTYTQWGGGRAAAHSSLQALQSTAAALSMHAAPHVAIANTAMHSSVVVAPVPHSTAATDSAAARQQLSWGGGMLRAHEPAKAATPQHNFQQLQYHAGCARGGGYAGAGQPVRPTLPAPGPGAGGGNAQQAGLREGADLHGAVQPWANPFQAIQHAPQSSFEQLPPVSHLGVELGAQSACREWPSAAAQASSRSFETAHAAASRPHNMSTYMHAVATSYTDVAAQRHGSSAPRMSHSSVHSHLHAALSHPPAAQAGTVQAQPNSSATLNWNSRERVGPISQPGMSV